MRIFIHSIFLLLFIFSFTSSISSYAQIQNPQIQNPQAQTAVKQASEFTGAWRNEAGSLATFTVTNGQVHGTYQTNVGQPDKNQSFPLIGFVEDDQITFTVNFKGYNSMTAWVGQMLDDDKGQPYIKTLWHLTKNIDDEKEQDDIWKSIITGASDFKRYK